MEEFLRNFVFSSISSLDLSAFYMCVPFKGVPYKKACIIIYRNRSQNSFHPGGGGALDQILVGDVPSRFQKHTRSLYQLFEKVYPTLYFITKP